MFTINGRDYNGDKPIDLSIPLVFNSPQPNAFGVEPAASTACEYGELIGDTRRGGSCNFEQIIFIPHCNGTHTECVGHITDERLSIRECLTDVFLNALLISVQPGEIGNDNYASPVEVDDEVITLSALTSPTDERDAGLIDALIVRTLPNEESRLTRQYGASVPPFFSNDAIDYLVNLGIKHLLVDLPSIDRSSDEGKLSNHHIFWGVELGARSVTPTSRQNSTITELIYVPNTAPDGQYLLNLQIAPFASDVAPSRPIIFPILQEH